MVNDKIVDVRYLNINWDSTLIVTVDFSKVSYDKREELHTNVEVYMQSKFPSNRIVIINYKH